MGGGLIVASMVAQAGFGESAEQRLKYSALAECLDSLARRAASSGASVHMPRIGAGQAGGIWRLVADEIDAALCRRGVSVVVYTRPGEHVDTILSEAIW
jgi:O-acetyl-ADP-ribose deacetylase (regulator of RNase III)